MLSFIQNVLCYKERVGRVFIYILIFIPVTVTIRLPFSFISDEDLSVLLAPMLISEACINLAPYGSHFELIK